MLRQLAEGKWTFETAAHLLNRAGFGGPPSEIDSLLALGQEGAVSRLVDFERVPDDTPAPEWAKPDPEYAATVRSMQSAAEEERRQMYRERQQEERQHLVNL